MLDDSDELSTTASGRATPRPSACGAGQGTPADVAPARSLAAAAAAAIDAHRPAEQAMGRRFASCVARWLSWVRVDF